jgi:hypothetical protein
MRARAAALLFVAGGTGAWAQERRPLPVPDLPGLGLFQGMELVNGEDFYPAAYPWIEEKQLAILATSDYHLPTPPRGSARRAPSRSCSRGRPATSLLRVSVARDAPRGAHEPTLELEVENLHVGPGRSLSIALPVRLTVREP